MIDLTSRGMTGQLPTLHAGTYTGYLSGVTLDAEGNQWVTVTSPQGTHIEQTDLDLSEIPTGSRIDFEISPIGGARLGMRGTKYSLYGADNKRITDWLPLADIYTYIREYKPALAGLCITRINITAS